MKISAITLSSVALLGFASAAPLNDASAIGSYGFAPMIWSGPITPGGPEVQLNGTVQEIVAQIKVLNPEWKPLAPPAHALEARDWDGSPTCNQVEGIQLVNQSRMDEVINHLWGIGGNCGAPGHQCTNPSCAWHSGIWVCNDHNEVYTMPCAKVAEGARKIVTSCGAYKGQLFHTDGWNVVVRGHPTC
ncbi:hypothetical protein ABW21_db0200824 [Orbilia brochopaga]|nr:hypothetical protein ABW21_db0200824 [Drechslerella brochopaga]